MGKMNANYGSELHLLRWMGRHRDAFNRKVYEATGLKVSRWLDFGFSTGEKAYDVELRGLSFLPEEIRKEVEFAFPTGWSRSMSWDAVGVAEDGTWILVEAKAAAGELKSSVRDRASMALIQEKLFALARKLNGTPQGWIGAYYQAANRIFVQGILENHAKAIQLNVYFCGDRRGKVICPDSREAWQPYIRDEYDALGLDPANAFLKRHIFEMYISVDHE